MSKEQRDSLIIKAFYVVATMLLTFSGFVLSSIYNKIESTHDSQIRTEEQIIRVEGRIILEKQERELWQMHLQGRIDKLELELSGK